MIKLKQAGNTVKCKVDGEYMISRYECMLLASKQINKVAATQLDKNGGLVYAGATSNTLGKRLYGGIGELMLKSYLFQISRTLLDVSEAGLNSQKLILNPDWIYVDQDGVSLRFLYCPVNGAAIQYDGILFMRELVLYTGLGMEQRKKWNDWLDEIAEKGITEQSLEIFTQNAAPAADSYVPQGGTAGTTYYQQPEQPVNNYYQQPEQPVNNYYQQPEQPVNNYYQQQPEQPVNNYYQPQQEPAANPMDDPFAWAETPSADVKYPVQDAAGEDALTGLEDDPLTGMEDDYSWTGTPEKQSYSSYPTLYRRSTGERCEITKAEFIIGRSEQRADFCIRGNSGVSNVHAAIVWNGDGYYAKDYRSTNGTYVDGIRISSDTQGVLLKNGSVIRVYNEDIIFNF